MDKRINGDEGERVYTTDLRDIPFDSQQAPGPALRSRYSDFPLAERFGDRILVGAKFSAPVQTSPGAHSSSCTWGTGSFSYKQCSFLRISMTV